MSYDKWRKRLDIANLHKTVDARRTAIKTAGVVNFSQPDEADEGYYRKPVTKKDESGNGKNVITGWVPVSYFMWEGKLEGSIGSGDGRRDMTDRELGDEELWSYVVSHPISYETYKAVAEQGQPWPDLAAADLARPIPTSINRLPAGTVMGETVPAANREVASTDNKPEAEPLPLDVQHATSIDNAIGAGKSLPVTTAGEAAIAAGAANVIRDRRLAAEKVAKGRVEPLQRVYEAERDKWLPLVKRAKTAEEEIRTKVSRFEADEIKRVAAEQLAALEKQREIDEAAARAADRAIAAGKPEPAPVVETVVIPQAPTPVKPTYGGYVPRAKPVLKFAVINDAMAVFKYFEANADLQGLIQKLATNAIRSGLEVPGTTTREGTE